MVRENATACYRELGEELRKRRQDAGLTATEIALRMGWERSKISRIESGQVELSDVDMIWYLGFCGVYGRKALQLLPLCHDAGRKLGHWLSPHGDWLEDSLTSLIYHESTANSSTIYEPQLVDGLLQTADYARARVGAERWRTRADVELCVRIRMDRQRILRVPRLPRFAFFLHERALRVEVGSAAIMHEQLLQIVFATALSNVTVRVVQSAAGEEFAFGGPFHLLEYDRHAPLVYLDNHATGLFLEDPDFVEPYPTLVAAMADIALDEGQSRELIAALADEYDRGSERDGGDSLEEEQF